MYTGKVEQPCCLCADPDVVTRLDLPPRAVPEMKHSGPIAWRDIVGEVSIHFCASDWETVVDLVLSTGMSPLPRCNVARASFDLREDFEALTNQQVDEPDQRPTEQRMLAESREVREDPEAYTERERVEALVIESVLAEAEVAP